MAFEHHFSLALNASLGPSPEGITCPPGHLIAVKLFVPVTFLVIRFSLWNKFPQDIKDIFDDQAAKTQREYLAWLKSDEDRAIQSMKDGGGVIKPFPTDKLNEWKSIAPDGLDNWVKDMEGKGYGETARRVADRWRETIGR